MYYYLLLIVFTSTFAEKPRVTPCCTSYVFESVITEIGGTRNPTNGNITLIDFSAELIYDYAQRIIKVERIVNGALVTVLTDYKKKTTYTIIGNKCTAITNNATMTPPCVPFTATLVGTNFLGSIRNRQHLDMHIWKIDLPTYTIKLSVTDDDCTPLAQSSFGVIDGVQTEVTYLFSNFTKGIERPSDLELPTECHGVTPTTSRKRSYEEEIPTMAFTLF